MFDDVSICLVVFDVLAFKKIVFSWIVCIFLINLIDLVDFGCV